MVERQDWSFPTPVKIGQDAPLPGSVVPVPDKALSQQLVEMETEWAADADADGEVLDGFPDHQIEVIQTAVEMNLAILPAGFAEAFDQAPEGATPAMWLAVRKKVAGVLARSPHLQGQKLFDACFRSFNLEETAAADLWLGEHPEFFG